MCIFCLIFLVNACVLKRSAFNVCAFALFICMCVVCWFLIFVKYVKFFVCVLLLLLFDDLFLDLFVWIILIVDARSRSFRFFRFWSRCASVFCFIVYFVFVVLFVLFKIVLNVFIDVVSDGFGVCVFVCFCVVVVFVLIDFLLSGCGVILCLLLLNICCVFFVLLMFVFVFDLGGFVVCLCVWCDIVWLKLVC